MERAPGWLLSVTVFLGNPAPVIVELHREDCGGGFGLSPGLQDRSRSRAFRSRPKTLLHQTFIRPSWSAEAPDSFPGSEDSSLSQGNKPGGRHVSLIACNSLATK